MKKAAPMRAALLRIALRRRVVSDLDHFAIATEVRKGLANASEFAHELNKTRRIDRRVEIEIEHKFKIPLRKGSALKLDEVDV